MQGSHNGLSLTSPWCRPRCLHIRLPTIMRLIGVRSLLECDEVLTNARSPRLLTGRPPWFPSTSAAALDQARRCPSEGRPTVHRRRIRSAHERKEAVDLRSNWSASAIFNTDDSIRMAALRSGPAPHRRRHLPLASRAVWVRCVPAPKPISRHLRFQRP